MQITITNDGSVPAQYELGVKPKLLLQPGESITVDLSPQSPVIVRVPENLAELEKRARELENARALIADEENRLTKEAEEQAKADAEAKKAEKAAKKAEKSATQAPEDTNQPETATQTAELFDDAAVNKQNTAETDQENKSTPAWAA